MEFHGCRSGWWLTIEAIGDSARVGDAANVCSTNVACPMLYAAKVQKPVPVGWRHMQGEPEWSTRGSLWG